LILLATVISQEFLTFDAGGTRVTPMLPALVFVAGAAFVGLTGLALYSALTREADLYGIDNDRRGFYVYLTELLVVAFLAHVRLNRSVVPSMLGGYWYLSVIVLAFIILALSEICKRKQLPVLALPLERSATVLVFVPILAFRLAFLAFHCDPIERVIPGLQPFLAYLKTLSRQTVAEGVPMEALCWLLLGVFFGSLAQLRRSANYGIFAALAINFGVWVLLGHQDATTFIHSPQLWLIPLGLIILVAEHLNRERLGFWPSLSLRYAGLLCIYLSSTIEMFMAGLGKSVWLPIVLMFLAVAGMLLGILFRVRAFLLAGFMALLIVIFAQIWHAAVDREHVWVWWATVIVFGIAILTLFALFEKHRNEVLKVIDNMKQWN
jgi:hypothetical protein